MTKSAIDIAISRAGGIAHLARAIGSISITAVAKWRRNATPLDRCPTVEALTGVRCEDLRPDVEWTRDEHGQVTGYRVRVDAAATMREVA